MTRKIITSAKAEIKNTKKVVLRTDETDDDDYRTKLFLVYINDI